MDIKQMEKSLITRLQEMTMDPSLKKETLLDVD
jgi:hypothetical protein